MTKLFTTSPDATRALSAALKRAEVLAARERFNLEATWAGLPPATGPRTKLTQKGAAGQRLRADLRTDWPEPLLREFARDTLGAVRIRSGYLEALRVVLGNQAHAERHGYTLEQNVRVDFVSVQVMRTINEQMNTAGITQGRTVALGNGRVQTMQVFVPVWTPRVEDLCAVMRREEEQAEARFGTRTATIPDCITAEDIPY